ncbi:UDP-N-acetylglucosamine 1-carboxyvinyltransferase [Candidatus Dojkabacteria bacterium]|uniref:UDP-N-acetylglucosamine 1-carboxyvinyltransferase n=1 Tax=Candidatus Dojkabacteria bacterium TaxID=2099670 RepID=A0A955IB36_9BACT|nr:UDP-N-acetylglucosamine 1-carboxyvinyltransferase [Candidatus Dojkabacteria bacterium]
MSTYKITGGIPLHGEVTPTPNKNAVLPAIAAALLTDEIVTLHNVPKSSDVRIMLRLIRKMGGKISYSNMGNTVKINASTVDSNKLDAELSKKIQAASMFMAPLLVRFKSAFMPIPGGCKLGTRPLDAFIGNMESMGATYEPTDKGFYLHAEKLKANKIWSWFPSVTGTENLIMLASRVPGRTEIYNAACEPHVAELCHLLVSMGAKIEGIGSNRLTIEGVEELHGAEQTIISDHLDIAEYVATAAVTGGAITVKNAIPEHMDLILQAFQILGIKTKYEGDNLIIPAEQKRKIKETVKGNIFDIKALFWPMFPPDVIHSLVVTALASEGTMIFHNSFYEYGFFFVEELAKLKGNVVMADPHRILTFGPTKWRPGTIVAPNIIAATKSLLVAALAAEGTSILHDETDMLMRRYPTIIEDYKSLGAKIEKV